MIDWIKDFFVEPNTDAALGVLAKTSRKLEHVETVHRTLQEAREKEAADLKARALANQAEAVRANQVRNRLDKLCNGD